MARAARVLDSPLVSIPTAAQAAEALANVLDRAGPLAVVIHGLEGADPGTMASLGGIMSRLRPENRLWFSATVRYAAPHSPASSMGRDRPPGELARAARRPPSAPTRDRDRANSSRWRGRPCLKSADRQRSQTPSPPAWLASAY